MGKYLMAEADVSGKTVLREVQYEKGDSIDDQIIIDTPGKIWSLIRMQNPISFTSASLQLKKFAVVPTIPAVVCQFLFVFFYQVPQKSYPGEEQREGSPCEPTSYEFSSYFYVILSSANTA